MQAITKYRRSIRKVYEAASFDAIAAGFAWYETARKVAEELLPENPCKAAGVIAALSPRTSWEENKIGAAKIIAAWKSGQPQPVVAGVPLNRAKAWRIVNGESPLVVLGGDKVTRFYQNIIGNWDCVTVDVWATRVAGITEVPGGSPRGNLYRNVEAAYRAEAKRANIAPAVLQAITWVAIRGQAN